MYYLIPNFLIAQVIPAADGTGTVVNTQGNQIDLTGGSASRDGQNLFHSLEKLGISRDKTLNFQTGGAVRNIFTRIRGGEASVIDGLLQVRGSGANLFLMNPAGFLFGPNVRLQLPGSFTATTATELRFEGGGFGVNSNYGDLVGNLVGNPNGFIFGLGRMGAIANAGTLEAQGINLLGGTVVNTGTIKGGRINVVAGQEEIRVGQDGNLLSLGLRPQDLPLLQRGGPGVLGQLLAQGQNIQNAPELQVNAAGEVQLKGSGVVIQDGAAVVTGQVTGERLAVVGRDVVLHNLDVQVPGIIDVQAQNALSLDNSSAVGFDFGGGGLVQLAAGESFRAASPVRSDGRSIVVMSPNIQTQSINTATGLGLDGSITLQGLDGGVADGVKTGILFTPGRGVTVLGKQVETEFIITTGSAQTQGEVRVEGLDRLRLGGVVSGGQPVSLTSGGLLKSGLLLTYGGDVKLKGDRVDGSLIWTSPNQGGKAGDIAIEAKGDLQVRQLEAIGKGDGRGGNVSVVSQTGNVAISSVKAYGEINASGGNVTISGDRVQITSKEAMVLPDGTQTQRSIRADGTVEIQHRGGNRNQPFLIGDRSYNGTAGTIISGGQVLAQGKFNLGRRDRLDVPVAGVTVVGKNQSPRFPADSENVFQRSVRSGERVEFSLAELGIKPPVDPDNDQMQIYIRLKNSAANSGKLLDGLGRLVDGTRPVKLTDRLVYVAPVNVGVIVDGFEIVVTDLPLDGTDLFGEAEGLGRGLRLVFNSRNLIPPVEPTVLETPAKTDVTAGTSGLTEVSAADVALLDKGLSKEYTDAGIGEPSDQPVENPLDLVKRIQREAGVRSALIYLYLPPGGDSRPLELVLVTAKGAFRKRLTAPQGEIVKTAAAFRSEVTNPLRTGTTSYLPMARKLNRWIIDPLRGELNQQGIKNLVFLPQAGLRSIPFAALHDGNRFLIEDFSVGMMPSVGLTQTAYQDVRQAAVYAGGIAKSTQGQIALPMVGAEIGAIAKLWPQSMTTLDSQTTLDKLQTFRKDSPYRIVHLATHANFTAGNPKGAYIQLWDERLKLEELKKLNWHDPAVELLVLSACRTALGDRMAELGFAGIAVQAGVKTVVASLWYVSDTATTALSSEFYAQLRGASSKAEALRLAQLALMKGRVKPVGDRIVGLSRNLELTIPEETQVSDPDFRHPYYWAAFTMVGNPW